MGLRIYRVKGVWIRSTRNIKWRHYKKNNHYKFDTEEEGLDDTARKTTKQGGWCSKFISRPSIKDSDEIILNYSTHASNFDHFHNAQCRYICMVLQSAFGFHIQVFKLQTGFLPVTYKAVMSCKRSELMSRWCDSEIINETCDSIIH